MTRKATPDDVDEICLGLPELELGTSWGDRPTYKVPTGGKGKGFLLYRAPHRSATDPETGELSRQELLEVITDAWAAKAPKKPVTRYFADG